MFHYQWKIHNDWQSIAVQTENTEKALEPNSEAEFIAEHYFGYTKHKNKTFEYEVEHPKWMQKTVTDFSLKVDFEKNYGKAFKVLNNLTPTSVFLAVGSKISVGKKQRII